MSLPFISSLLLMILLFKVFWSIFFSKKIGGGVGGETPDIKWKQFLFSITILSLQNIYTLVSFHLSDHTRYYDHI